MEIQNIGIALSGGGIRATIFHLGVFKWLAENNLLEEVKRVSSVSGASLCVGLIYSHNGLKWPTSKEFLASVLPAIERTLTTTDLQSSALLRLIISPYYWNKKVNMIAKMLEREWGVHGNLSELSGDMQWYINCTTYETGKRFRFCKDNMGDYTVGYADKPHISLSIVMAASAGFPALIGPYRLKTEDYKWKPSKHPKAGQMQSNKGTLHLWDGGVYDNLGLESVFKPDNGGTLSKGLDYLIVSNASPAINVYHRQSGLSARNLKRLLDISMDQVTALRTRMVMDFFKQSQKGMYIKIGNSAEYIASKAEHQMNTEDHLLDKYLSDKEVHRAMNYPTTLRRPTEPDYSLLLRHGHETIECTYLCHCIKE